MENFFPALLDKFISADFLEKIRKKYHFDEEQTAQIRTVAEEMLPAIRAQAFWVSRAYSPETQPRSKASDTAYACVAISLGPGVDLLQDRYSDNGFLLQSYIVEVLASELLMRGYEAYNNYISEHTAQHVARYHFPGSEDALPPEMLPGLLNGLTQKITCNTAFCMQPKKSVVFISELTQDETVHCKAICIECTNRCCPNRREKNSLIRKRMADLPLTYGYRRIFGI